MKSKITAMAAALMALLCLASSASAQSTGTISTKGPFAEADIYSIDADGIYREIYVYSSTAATHSPGGPKVNAAVTYAYYLVGDTNTGELLDEGFGYIDGTLSVGKKLSGASLSATGTMVSFFDNSEHSIDLDLDFIPSGPAQNVSYVQHISFGALKFLIKFSGTSVAAGLDGSAGLDGVGLDQLFFADFGISKSSQLTISK